jgi:hypothetical protein
LRALVSTLKRGRITSKLPEGDSLKAEVFYDRLSLSVAARTSLGAVGIGVAKKTTRESGRKK